MMRRVCVFPVCAVFGLFVAPVNSLAAVPNSLILNEASVVSNTQFLQNGNLDTTLKRVEGNGQNWLELLVVQGDEVAGSPGMFKNRLDLRGWTLNWLYDKEAEDEEPAESGNGVITFSDDPLWASVPRGTLITISEWQDAWYLKVTPEDNPDPFPGAGGLRRANGVTGVGILDIEDVSFDAEIHQKLGATPTDPDPKLFFTDTSWNPADGNTGAPGLDGDWRIHVYAGERNPDTSFKFFNFGGDVTIGEETFEIGTPEAGLFAVNNDGWELTIREKPVIEGQPGAIIQGPIGEDAPGNGYNLGSDEVLKLEAFQTAVSHTQSDYLGVTHARYNDGATSTFGLPNAWSGGNVMQNFEQLRDWVVVGDADLDGIVTAVDYVIWRRNAGGNGGWRQGDFNGDKSVDEMDFGLWRSNFGSTTPAASSAAVAALAVPEPNSMAFFVSIVLVAATGRRHQRQLKH